MAFWSMGSYWLDCPYKGNIVLLIMRKYAEKTGYLSDMNDNLAENSLIEEGELQKLINGSGPIRK